MLGKKIYGGFFILMSNWNSYKINLILGLALNIRVSSKSTLFLNYWPRNQLNWSINLSWTFFLNSSQRMLQTWTYINNLRRHNQITPNEFTKWLSEKRNITFLLSMHSLYCKPSTKQWLSNSNTYTHLLL